MFFQFKEDGYVYLFLFFNLEMQFTATQVLEIILIVNMLLLNTIGDTSFGRGNIVANT